MYKIEEQKLEILKQKIKGKNYILWFLNDELINHKVYPYITNNPFKALQNMLMTDFKSEVGAAIGMSLRNSTKNVGCLHQRILECLKGDR